MEFTEILATLRRRWRWGVTVGGAVALALVAYALLMPSARAYQSWQEYQVTVIFVPTAATPTASAEAAAYIESQMYTYAQVALNREIQARAFESSGIERDDPRIGGITLTYGGDNNYQLIVGSNSGPLAEEFLGSWASETIDAIDALLPDGRDAAVAAEQLGRPELSFAPSETPAGTSRILALPLAPILGLVSGIGACCVVEVIQRRRLKKRAFGRA